VASKLVAQQSVLRGKFENPLMRRVRYGPGAIDSLAADVAEFGGTRVMLVAGSHLARETDLVRKVERLLGKLHATTFVGVPQHGPRRAVLDGAATARRHEVDLVISFGGGSPIDAVKLITMCLAENVHTLDDLERYVVKFEYPDKLYIPPMNARSVPHIAISTTLSAGEFSKFAGALNEERQVKELYVGDKLQAREVIIDPGLTVNTPAWLWGASGARAIDHCVETILSARHMPFTDATAVEGLGLLMANLVVSTREPYNLAARGACQVGAWLSLYALDNVTLGLSHGIGHQIGGAYNVTHGVTSAIMLPWVMEYNLPATLGRQKRLAGAMGVDTAAMSDEEAGRTAIAEVRRIFRELELPMRLRDVGVPREGFKHLVDNTMVDMVVVSNPRPVTEAAVYELLEKAY
jgi:alcohol dehydrogenase class IV